MKIVLVEDNDDLRFLLKRDLSKSGYEVEQASCAEELDEIASTTRFDVMILDINLPGEDGYSIARRFRRANPKIHIVMLTVRESTADRVTGYDSGADIYLPKPVSSEELAAAIKSIERRISTNHTQSFATLNLRAMTLTGSSTVSLSRTEIILLKAFSESDSGKLPYYRLIELCGEVTDAKSKATLEVRIVRLRKKLLAAGLGEHAVKALRTEGYQLTTHITVA